MNRFILHTDPVISAQYHCDKHVVKMILEEAQMLSTVHQRYDSGVEGLYKPTHKHHPCTVWAGDSVDNYLYGHAMFVALCDEYTVRYGKVHASARLIEPLSVVPAGVPDEGLLPFPQAMPDEFKCADPVDGYRKYYCTAKAGFARWTVRDVPEWFTPQV